MKPSVSRLVIRSFFGQALWNPRDLVGAGFAWALGATSPPPASSEADQDSDQDSIQALSVENPSLHFNAHPYLTPLALGALTRAQADGASADACGRFQDALRAPLGALGDGLFWAGWLPFTLLLTGLALVLGLVSPVGGIFLFLVLFNGLHIAVRVWGAGAGLRAGLRVGKILAERGLAQWGERARGGAVVSAGVLAGALGSGVQSGHFGATLPGNLLLTFGLLALGLGLWVGPRLRVSTPAFGVLLLLGAGWVASYLGRGP